jgi:hypothetical protein
MSKRRPSIQADNEYIRRVDYIICQGEDCRNAIATWLRTAFCSRCRKRKR